MHDIERLHETYANPSNERQSGKTTMNCFNLAGYIDVLNTPNIFVFHQNYALSDYFSRKFYAVLNELNFKFEISRKGSDIIYTVKDTYNFTKVVTLTTADDQKIYGLRGAVYNIDHNSIDNCYLDLSCSGISPEDNDYSSLIKA